MRLADLRREYRRRCGDTYQLCVFCRFPEFTEDGEPICKHPLGALERFGTDMFPGDDCWAFRPARDMGLDVIDQRIAEWLEQEES